QNGWTAIEFKRKLDTCDTTDVPINSGTNILIFAYGLTDVRDGEDIQYHDERSGSKLIPLLSYVNPPDDSKFNGPDTFEFRLNNYTVPPTDTTYYCKIFKIPTYVEKRHAIAHKMLINDKNRGLIHHLLIYECDSTSVFDDNNLPDGLYDTVYTYLEKCASNIELFIYYTILKMVKFPEEAGYPVSGDFPVKYYLLQMHYDNQNLSSNIIDSSGTRFYLIAKLRENDLGYLTFGNESALIGIAIPPNTDRFIIDTYCTANFTQ
ncbi:unnamed protein product, partial [Didymodactylos carnosus]